jgi:hypothetical protein
MTKFRNRNQFKSFGHLDIGVWNSCRQAGIWFLGFGIWDLIVWRTIDGAYGPSF